MLVNWSMIAIAECRPLPPDFPGSLRLATIQDLAFAAQCSHLGAVPISARLPEPPQAGTPNPQSIVRPNSTAILRAEATRKARVLVVEDDTFVRRGVVLLLNLQADLACCGEAESIAATPLLMAKEKPDLLLLDLQLKDGKAFELIPSVHLHFPATAILVFSQCEEASHAGRVLRTGANGYVMKQAGPDELLNAIRRVLADGIYLSNAITGRTVPGLAASLLTGRK